MNNMEFENASCELNAVSGYNPLNYLVERETMEGPIYLLPLTQQIAWFRLKHPEGKISKKLLMKSGKTFGLDVKLYALKSDAPENYLAASYQMFGEGATNSTITQAEQAAIASVLNEAGFGIQFCKKPNIPETPISTEEKTAVEEDVTDTAEDAVQKEKEVIAAAEDTAQEEETEETIDSDIPSVITSDSDEEDELYDMSLEEAKILVMPSGMMAGKTLEEIAVNETAKLVWIANEYKGDMELVIGARTLLKAAGVPC